MAGMGPPPKPSEQRRRTNATVGTTKLPMEGYTGPVPEWPLAGSSKAELDRWERVWHSPMASQWVRMHIDLVVARYVRSCILIEGDPSRDDDAHLSVATAHLHSEVRQLEDRLGLSPLALLRLRWEIAPDEVTERRDEKPTRRRLKAVDADAVAGS